jgi:tetraacyldisaccharide 4'-kinase
LSAQSPQRPTKNSHATWLNAWYGPSRWTFTLLPLTWIFIALAGFRRFFILRYLKKSLPTPVVVVGNISVGGTGKTPLIIALVKWLQKNGYAPGIISRGYGSEAKSFPYLLDTTSTAREAGDEPLTIFQQTGAPVAIGPDRIASGRLLEDQGCDILLSDDGLQHYRLARDIEIAVVDGSRGLGNGWRLPLGPLREPAARLTSVDWVVVNSPAENFTLPAPGGQPIFHIPMAIRPRQPIHLKSGSEVSCAELPKQVIAVAGIGNPQRFENTLIESGFEPDLHAFPDHHAFTQNDFMFADSRPVIMTEKDAVKCREFAQDHWFYLPVSAELPQSFWDAFAQKLERVIGQKRSRFPIR